MLFSKKELGLASMLAGLAKALTTAYDAFASACEQSGAQSASAQQAKAIAEEIAELIKTAASLLAAEEEQDT